MNLIAYHVLQTLIVSRTKEYHYFQFFTSETIIHDLVSMTLVAQFMKCRTNVVNTLTLEWGSITLISVEGCHFT